MLFTQSCLTLWLHGLGPARLFSPWDSPGNNTGVGCHFLLQGIFLNQGSNPALNCGQTLPSEPLQFSSVRSLSCAQLFVTHEQPGLPVHHQLLEFTQTHVHWVGDTIQPSHPLWPLLFLPSIFPSIRVFSNESALRIRWPKHRNFSFNISLSNEPL